jgi:hypothetical protein
MVAQDKYDQLFLVERHAYLADQIKENEMGEAYSTYWGEERFIKGFGGKT